MLAFVVATSPAAAAHVAQWIARSGGSRHWPMPSCCHHINVWLALSCLVTHVGLSLPWACAHTMLDLSYKQKINALQACTAHAAWSAIAIAAPSFLASVPRPHPLCSNTWRMLLAVPASKHRTGHAVPSSACACSCPNRHANRQTNPAHQN